MTKFGGDDDLVPPGSHRSPQHTLTLPTAIDICGIKQRNAEIKPTLNGAH
jgi:hypothetical protein